MSKPHQDAPDVSSLLKIGITGGIGAGKSTICRIFAALGIPVYDADSNAKRLLVEDAVLVDEIKNQFGESAYLADGSLNRTWLAGHVFDKPDQLALLNSLVHPRVGYDFQTWLVANSSAPYVLKEAALLFESGSYLSLDAIITVTAPEPLRIRRTLMRDMQRSSSQVQEIIKRQLPEEERLKRAQFKIVNDDHSLVIPQVLRIHKQLLHRELPLKK